MRIRSIKGESEAVQIVAADFNGTDFDDSPFGEVPPAWLQSELSKSVGIDASIGDRDYAVLLVRDREERRVQAWPGDYLVWDGEVINVVQKRLFDMSYERA